MESILKRDRAIVLAGLGAVAFVAWVYMVREARGMSLTGVCCCAGMKMSGPDASRWAVGTLLPLFLMWAEMMVAMMLPSAAPMILTFAAVNRKRREREQPYVPTGIFLAGYLAVWALFSLMAAVAQWALHGAALLSPAMVSTSPWLGGALFAAAGIFQWTRFKRACLEHCRSPLNFLLTSWKEGKRGAFAMGALHGLHCTGCCWLLMTLLFAAGVMNIWWIAIISAFVLLEKISPRPALIGKVTGVLLAAWGTWMVLKA